MTDMKPDIDTGSRFSVIWIIPIVALIIGIWMVVQTKMSEGPTVTISFATADGLEAGKTKVKYLNVAIGVVESVNLNPQKDGILVKVALNPEAESLLTEETRFWVVTARIGAGDVSGLGTILSGAFITLDPGEGTAAKRRSFDGLETPPLTPVGAPGVKLVLYTKEAGSVSAGDAVLYNGYKVGRIEAMTFDPERIQMRYDVFVDAPYDSLVTSSVRFWNVSGINVTASADGVDIQTGSLDTVLLGGVAFANPPGISDGSQVTNGTEFKLYSSYADMQKQPYRYKTNYVMAFSQSLRGLVPGAPVEYRGIQIGTVTRILAKELLSQSRSSREVGAAIPVLVSIEPGRLGLPDTRESLDFLKGNLLKGVALGLRATLETGSLITGSLLINIDYYDNLDKAEVSEFNGYPTIPTIGSGLGRIEVQISTLLDKLNGLPLDTTLDSADDALASLNKVLASVDNILNKPGTQDLSAELSGAVAELRKILAELAPEGSAYQSLNSSINQLNDTLYNLDQLTRTLSDKPNALILPTNFPEDPQPEASRQ